MTFSYICKPSGVPEYCSCRGTGRAKYMVLCNVRKVSVWKHALLGGWGHAPPRKILEFKTSKIASAGFSGQVSVAKIIHIPGRKKTTASEC